MVLGVLGCWWFLWVSGLGFEGLETLVFLVFSVLGGFEA